MNHYAIKQSSFAACEEIWASAAAAAGARSVERRDTLVCPKPRRLGLVQPSFARPSVRWLMSHQQEDCDSKAGNDLLDIILAKGNCGLDDSHQHLASSPPFFSGSPPSRVSNPLIQDARFGKENNVSAASPRGCIINASGPALSPRKGGCVRANFGNSPAVRVEGFNCLNRDRRNCGIPTLA